MRVNFDQHPPDEEPPMVMSPRTRDRTHPRTFEYVRPSRRYPDPYHLMERHAEKLALQRRLRPYRAMGRAASARETFLNLQNALPSEEGRPPLMPINIARWRLSHAPPIYDEPIFQVPRWRLQHAPALRDGDRFGPNPLREEPIRPHKISPGYRGRLVNFPRYERQETLEETMRRMAIINQDVLKKKKKKKNKKKKSY